MLWTLFGIIRWILSASLYGILSGSLLMVDLIGNIHAMYLVRSSINERLNHL